MSRRALLVWGLCLIACGGGSSGESGSGESGSEGEPLSPEERRYLDAGRPFAEALAAGRYDVAYARLSSHGRARLSPNQFAPADQEGEFVKREALALSDAQPADFARLMGEAEAQFGKPRELIDLHVHETDPAVLAGTSKGRLAQLDHMLAIGNIPASIPGNVRKASLRGQIRVELSAEKLAEAAKAMNTTPEALLRDEDFRPYMNVKIVLVEDAGALAVGYFELLPPSMLD